MTAPARPNQVHAAAHLRALTVLYVHGEEGPQASAQPTLRQWPGGVLATGDPGEAIAACQASRPVLVVTDLGLPGLDGLALAEEIRSRDPDLPIIVIATCESMECYRKALDLRLDRYLVRPVAGERLQAALLACAHRLQAQAEPDRRRQAEAEGLRLRHREAMGQLARGLAHDFNNLLQATVGCISVAKQMAEPDTPVRRVLDLSDRITANAQGLSQRLQILSREGKAPSRVASLEPLVRQALQEVLGGSAVAWTCQWPADLPALRHDPLGLRETLVEFIRNARDAMPSGGTLAVAARRRTLHPQDAPGVLPGEYAELSFQDTGRGIPPEDLDKVFNPYFTTKPLSSLRGTGLGLTLCQTVAGAHGGAVLAESKPGEGATFRLLLPLAAREEGAPTPLAPGEAWVE